MSDFLDTIWLCLEYIPFIITVCSAITAVTPTPKDDEIWGKIYKYLEILALVVGKAKQLPPR